MILGALVDVGLDPEDLRAEMAKLGVEGYELRFGRAMKHHLDAADVDVVVHEHVHGRTAAEIMRIIEESKLDPWVRQRAARVVRRLAEAEAKIHGSTVDQIHLHEVGGIDCIVDICGAVAGLRLLGVEKVFCSPLPLSRAYVSFSHGTWPAPAPATLELLRGTPVASLDVEGETLTPTGAAVLTTLAEGYGGVPAMRLDRVGYGAGKKTFAQPIPNALRVLVGEAADAAPAPAETLTLLETSIDDMPPEWYEHVMDTLFARGALDVVLIPVQMKKNRPATLLSVLCAPGKVPALLETLYRETTTLGVRAARVERYPLDREMREVETPWGAVPVKVGRLGAEAVTLSPEYEACRRLAREKGVSLKRVYSAAQAAAAGELGDKEWGPIH